jgi:hypothetical protein
MLHDYLQDTRKGLSELPMRKQVAMIFGLTGNEKKLGESPVISRFNSIVAAMIKSNDTYISSPASMSDEDLKHILRRKSWPFRLSDVIDYYHILILPLTLLLFTVPLFGSVSESEYPLLELAVSYLVVLAGLSLTCFTLYRIRAEKKFHIIELTPEIREAKQLLFRNQFEDLDWTLIRANQRYLISKSRVSLTSWGETITLVIDNDRILFNSSSSQRGLSMDTDQVNLSKFLSTLPVRERHSA